MDKTGKTKRLDKVPLAVFGVVTLAVIVMGYALLKPSSVADQAQAA